MQQFGFAPQHPVTGADQARVQLQSALNSRVIIEQAKGVLAERQGLSMGQAFEYLRTTARASQRPIAEVAAETVDQRGLPTGDASAESSAAPAMKTQKAPVPGLNVPKP